MMRLLITLTTACLGLACGGTPAAKPPATADRYMAPPAVKGATLNGKKDGPWTVFHFDGTIESRGVYVDGERHGVWRWTWPNGAKHAQGTYKKGKKHGTWQIWARDGTLVSHNHFERGDRTASRVFRDAGDWRKRRCSSSDLTFRVVHASPALSRCRAQFPKARGQVTGRWAVDNDGVVSDVAIRSNTGNKALEACVEQIVWQTLFARPHRGRCLAERSLLLLTD